MVTIKIIMNNRLTCGSDSEMHTWNVNKTNKMSLFFLSFFHRLRFSFTVDHVVIVRHAF